jgi:hypothetical protein
MFPHQRWAVISEADGLELFFNLPPLHVNQEIEATILML